MKTFNFWKPSNDAFARIVFLDERPSCEPFFMVKAEPLKERTFEEILRDKGFESEAEFHRLVAKANLSTSEKRVSFKMWQEFDGTKAGLLELN